MKGFIGNCALHFGWALFGQECDCGHNLFNWLARGVQRVLPADSETVFKIGSLFVDAGTRLID